MFTMPLSPEQEWTLVLCGLMAHADGILEVGEWDQVLAMLEERLDQVDASEWVERLADREALQARLAALILPAPLFAESILHKAWRMALTDGRASEKEIQLHDTFSRRLEVPLEDVQTWRERWTALAKERAELVASAAARLMKDDTWRRETDVGVRYAELLGRLPLDSDRRSRLMSAFESPPSMVELAARCMRLSPDERRIMVVDLAPQIRDQSPTCRQEFLRFAESLAIARGTAEALLDRV